MSNEPCRKFGNRSLAPMPFHYIQFYISRRNIPQPSGFSSALITQKSFLLRRFLAMGFHQNILSMISTKYAALTFSGSFSFSFSMICIKYAESTPVN